LGRPGLRAFVGLSDAGSRLEAALDAIGAPAAIVDSCGQLIEANAAAGEVLASGVVFPSDLVDAMPRAASAWTVTPIDAGRNVREYRLVLRAAGEDALRDQVRRACERWSLTARQREALLMVVEGHSNQMIGTVLAISQRTVEVHVTALLDMAAAASRSALSARQFTLR